MKPPSEGRGVLAPQKLATLGGCQNNKAALWQVMRMFKIPDVDFLEQIYEGAKVSEQKFWSHQSTSTQPPIFLPHFLSHE